MSEETARKIAAKCWENNPTRGMAEREIACYDACIEMERQTIAEVLDYAEEWCGSGVKGNDTRQTHGSYMRANDLLKLLKDKFGEKE